MDPKLVDETREALLELIKAWAESNVVKSAASIEQIARAYALALTPVPSKSGGGVVSGI